MNVKKTDATKSNPDILSAKQINALKNKYPYLDVRKAQGVAKLCIESGIDLIERPGEDDIDKIGQLSDTEGRFQWLTLDQIVAAQRTRGEDVHPFLTAKGLLEAEDLEALRSNLLKKLRKTDLAINDATGFDPMNQVLATLKAHNRSAVAFVHYVGEKKRELDGVSIVKIAKDFVAAAPSPFENLFEAKKRIWGESDLPPKLKLLGIRTNMTFKEINAEPLETITVSGFLAYLDEKVVTSREENSVVTAARSYIEHMKSNESDVISISSTQVQAPVAHPWQALN